MKGTKVDKENKGIFWKMRFSKLLLSTGGEPRKLGVLGEDMEGVTTIRNITQANLIHKEVVL